MKHTSKSLFQLAVTLLLGSCLLVLTLEQAWAGDGSGLQFSVAVDILGKSGQAGGGTSDRVEVREAEVMLFAPADHLFDGMLSLAAHQESGVAHFEIHEAFIGSSKLIPRTRFRIGQYFLGIGRLNQFHRHDWPFVSAPRVHRTFFGSEGLLDTGLEFSLLTPLPFYFDISAGITNGWNFGHSHDEGNAPLIPTHYVRAVNYFDLPWNGGVQTGINYLGRKASDGTQFTFFGLDLTAKWKEGRRMLILVQSETWFRLQPKNDSSQEEVLGGYLYPQYGIDENWSFGVRGEYYSVLSYQDVLGRPISNAVLGLVPTLAFKPSEFSTLRLAYTHEWNAEDGRSTQQNQAVELQATFILGAHPAHDF